VCKSLKNCKAELNVVCERLQANQRNNLQEQAEEEPKAVQRVNKDRPTTD
jgi:hypothetical protein